jgi:cell division protein FtsZ
VIDDALGDEVRVTVIAAGFDRSEQAGSSGQGAGKASDDETVWPTPGIRRTADGQAERAAQQPEQPERGEPERREQERRRVRLDGDDDELDIPSFLKR